MQGLGIFVTQSRVDLVDVGFILNSARGWSRAKDDGLGDFFNLPPRNE